MNVHYDSLNDMMYAKIIPIFGTVKSHTDNYSINKNIKFNASFRMLVIFARDSRMSIMNVTLVCDDLIM